VSGTLPLEVAGGIIDTGPKPQRERIVSFIYSVKFICGIQNPSTTCTPVRPGGYATEINIHNFHPPGTPPPIANIQKRIILLVHNNQPVGLEPNVVTATPFATITLPPDSGTMDNCCNLGPNFAPNALNIGFLELSSNLALNVTAVYTATDLTATGVSTGISIDVQSVSPQQV
jgi:hypothetical protein